MGVLTSFYAVDAAALFQLRAKRHLRRLVKVLAYGESIPSVPIDPGALPSTGVDKSWEDMNHLLSDGVVPVRDMSLRRLGYPPREIAHRDFYAFYWYPAAVYWALQDVEIYAMDRLPNLKQQPVLVHEQPGEAIEGHVVSLADLPAVFSEVRRLLTIKEQVNDSSWTDDYGEQFDDQQIRYVFQHWCDLIVFFTEAAINDRAVVGIQS